MFFRVKLFSSNKVLQKRYAVVTLKKIVFFLQGYLKKSVSFYWPLEN
ncbi:hypothetical protein LEP1GSC032_1427 [Leptospira interrogans str. 2002000631]|uniref:Mobile element protein n=1 Tax=Leptospira interrogans serovar Hardjo str. Norma TaxID=1279460 RepID=A0A0M4N9K5_LEPIR|nr:hypothetical protein G436_4705 [Leptospira interrogans serovar Hardjo str. Norma]ALO02347.1 hypothetical protein LIH_18575 [Leptospira interrogans serovar Hardjo-prajitno]EMJ76688.1 hypothetical protein LEP1GSC032_1427 [Leptospira interrogans str. 2002000631]